MDWSEIPLPDTTVRCAGPPLRLRTRGLRGSGSFNAFAADRTALTASTDALSAAPPDSPDSNVSPTKMTLPSRATLNREIAEIRGADAVLTRVRPQVRHGDAVGLALVRAGQEDRVRLGPAALLRCRPTRRGRQRQRHDNTAREEHPGSAPSM
jgi:hypothetical protein